MTRREEEVGFKVLSVVINYKQGLKSPYHNVSCPHTGHLKVPFCLVVQRHKRDCILLRTQGVIDSFFPLIDLEDKGQTLMSLERPLIVLCYYYAPKTL